jgi:DNA polymerase III sliding clamp (beta) subunit (PCNA family)
MKIELFKDVSITGTMYIVKVDGMTEKVTKDAEQAEKDYAELLEKAKNNQEEFGRFILKSEEI